MTGIWLDNPKYAPQPNPFSNSGVITGDPGQPGTPGYLSGVAVLAEYTPYTITNSGQLIAAGSAEGVVLLVGGNVTNQLGGTITGGFEGVDIEGVGVVLNSGTITGTYAVVARPGSVITNGATNATGALVSGVSDGIFLGSYGYPASGTGTVTNFGSVRATGGSLLGNGIVLNTQTASVANYGTVIGTGATGGAAGLGIALNYGGVVTNSSSGLIQGYKAALSAGKGPATITNAGTIAGYRMGVRLYAGGSVTNSGSIKATATAAQLNQLITNGSGIYLKSGGSIVNQHGGYIYGQFGILSKYHTATIANFGTVMAAGSNSNLAGFGVQLNGGTVGNYAGAIIQGGGGVKSTGAYGAVYNDGTIVGNQAFGVALNSGGRIANSSSTSVITGSANGILLAGTVGALIINFGTISGLIGINASASYVANTVRNFGTIQGTPAIAFGTAGGRLVEFPQAAISGIADGGGGTLELGPGTQSGSLAGFGSNLIGFSVLQFDPSAPWTVEGSAAGFPGTITGFVAGDTIDVDGFVAVGDSYTGSALVLTDSASSSVTLGIQGAFSTGNFAITGDGHGGTDVTTAVCFCRGTCILTDRGEIPVEALEVGHRVKTLSGAFKPIVWIGMGRDLVTRKNSLARPILVRRGALADGLPHRDLYLTHGHALYFYNVLIPVENLVNHHSIAWDDTARIVEYYHIELADHDVVFAEGAPAETYYNANNRAFFQNTREGSEPGGEKPTFAPVMHDGEIVGRVWAELLERVGGGANAETTDDPDLHLIVEGTRLDATSAGNGLYTFNLERPPASPLRLGSRSGVPSLLGFSRHEHRRLGVAIRQMILHRPGVMTCFDHDAPLFGEGGCHPPEDSYCWTDGELILPAEIFAHLRGAFTLVVRTQEHAMRYPISVPTAQAARLINGTGPITVR